MLECYFDEWIKLKDVLILMQLRKDYLLIDKHLQKCYYQKKAWRQIKGKQTGHIYQVIERKEEKQDSARESTKATVLKEEESPEAVPRYQQPP